MGFHIDGPPKTKIFCFTYQTDREFLRFVCMTRSTCSPIKLTNAIEIIMHRAQPERRSLAGQWANEERRAKLNARKQVMGFHRCVLLLLLLLNVEQTWETKAFKVWEGPARGEAVVLKEGISLLVVVVVVVVDEPKQVVESIVVASWLL